MNRQQERRAGFDEWVVSATDPLSRYAFLLCGHTALAEDLTQESLLKTYVWWMSKGAPDFPDAFVRRVLVRSFLSWKRRRSTAEVVGDVSDVEISDGADDRANRDAVIRAISGLSARQKVVIVSRYYEGKTDAEIASLLNCAPGSVRSLASRAFVVLRQEFRPSAVRESTEGS